MINRFAAFILCTLPLFVFSQFDPKNFDQKLLEHEIKILIDSTRKAHHLQPLFNDSILYVAAGDHARYMLKKGELSHEQNENKDKISPQKRAAYFGAPKSYFVGENVAYTAYNASVKVKDRTYRTTNYREIARSLVYGWINSKGHFKNIIHPDFQVTGLSVSVDPKLKRIYACQKFAHVVYTYTFYENQAFFPYSTLNNEPVSKEYPIEKYPFGLRTDKVEKCETCRDEWNHYPPISVRIKNKNFILRIENADFVKSLIQGKNDGFAVEIVPFDAFACGNPAYEEEPSRRNQMKRTSGTLLEPVFRNDLMKGFKKRKKVKDVNFVNYIFTADSVSFFKRFGRYKLVNFDAKYFEYKLGRIPKGMDGWWNHNLVYIKDKQICHFTYLTNYPGKLHTEFVEVDYIPPVPVNNYQFKLEHFSDTLELLYNPNQTTTVSAGLGKLIKRFEEQSLTVKTIEIYGLSSVEGDSLANEQLHRERAAIIRDELKKVSNPETAYFVQSETAWKQFYESVKEHPKWKFLYPLSQKEISDYLSNPKNERPHEILAKQRKATVIITAVKELSSKTANYYVNRDIANLFTKDSYGKISCRDVDALRAIYQKAFYFSTVDTLSASDLLNIRIPDFPSMSHELRHDLTFYRYHYRHEKADKSELMQLESSIERLFQSCGLPDHLSAEFHYLSARLLINKIERQGTKIQPNNADIQKAFDRLSLLLDSYELDSTFYLNVSKINLNLINLLCMNIDPDQIYEYSQIANRSLIQIVEYYRRSDLLNPQSVVKLSELLCYFNNIPLAVELCRDFLDDNEVLKLYLPLAYTHSSYLTGEDELEFEKDFYDLLFHAKQRLTPEEWCRLFYGEEGIPFQVMDHAKLHAEFCASCPNRVQELFETEAD